MIKIEQGEHYGLYKKHSKKDICRNQVKPQRGLDLCRQYLHNGTEVMKEAA